MRPTLSRAAFGVALAASLFLGAAPVSAQQQFDVDTLDDSVDALPGDGLCADADGNCSLRAAVQEANASGGAAIINLDKNATYTLSIAGADEDAAATGDLDVTTQIELRGANATIDAAMLDRVFDVFAGASLALDRVTLSNGAVSAASGGAVRSAGSLSIDRSTLSGNSATGMGASGGGVFNDGGLLTVSRSEISGGDAERAGGAIEANGGITRVDRSDLLDNTAGPTPGNGGALHLTGAGIVEITRSEISGNSAASEGGGVWNSADGTMTVDQSDVLDNVAQGDAADNGGGGLFNDGGVLGVLRSTVSGNSATGASGSGGGVFNNGGSLNAFRALISENSANRAGGAVEANGGSSVINRSKLLDNMAGAAPGNGGALHLTGTGTVLVSNSSVDGNTASAEGGGLWNSGDGTMSVVGSKLNDNVASGADADQGGGGLFNDGGLLEVDRTQVRNNVADGASGSGGGLLNNLGSVFLSKSGFVNNLSMRAGGGVEANVGFSLLIDVLLKGNSTGAAPGNGGGLHLTGAGLVALLGGSVSGNDAAAEGGGLWNSSTGSMSADGTKLSGNSAPLGPDVFNDGGDFVIDASDVPPTDP